MKALLADLKMFVKTARHIESLCRGNLFLKLISAILDSVQPFVNIYMSSKIVDMLLSDFPMEEILVYVGITVGLHFSINLLNRLLWYFIRVRDNLLNNNYRRSKKAKVAELDYDLVDNVETQKTLNKIFQYENMNSGGILLFYYNAPNLIHQIFTIIFSVAMAFSLFISPYPSVGSGIAKYVVTPYFGAFVLLLCVMSVWLSVHCSTKRAHYATNEWQKFTFVNQFLSSIFTAMYETAGSMQVRIYNQKKQLLDALHANAKTADAIGENISRYQLKHETIITGITETVMQIVLYTFAGLGALVGRFSVGSIVKYISSILKFTNAVAAFVSILELLRYNNAMSKIYFDFIETPSHMYQGSLTVEKRSDRNYNVEFRDVSFRYPNTDFWALRHVNLKFNIGEKLAVVGMNGSGKTTMIKLMCRLYDPTEGQIFLNGIDIRKYDYKEYMSIFSVVFQDFKLFAFTLGENVATGTEYDEERVKACLVEANFGDRLATLEKGTKTYLYRNFEKDGVEISGGEAQKIALARALYKDAPFIILDEPTAALDPIAEAEVYSNFNKIVGDKTAIYISHRLSSCRFCDKIAVFDRGSIVQVGTHDELVADVNGKYHELWNAQAQYYSDKKEDA